MSIQNQIEDRPRLLARLRDSDTVRTFLACAAAAAIIGATFFVLAGLLDNWPAIRAGIAGLLEAAGGLQFGLVASLALWAMTAASWVCAFRHLGELRWMAISTVITTAYVLMLAGLSAHGAGVVSVTVCLFVWAFIGLDYYSW